MKCPACQGEMPEGGSCPKCGPPTARAVGPAPPAGGQQAYNVVADKVGFVPNVRKTDNLVQGLSILAAVVIGAGVGVVLGGVTGLLLGILAGLVGGLLISGAVLAVVGLLRKS